jgi:hypothetical protein
MSLAKPALKPFQRSLSLIIIPVTFVLFYIYGWTFISIVCSFDNFFSHLPEQYHVSKFSFAIYNLLVAVISGLLTYRLIIGVIKNNGRHVKRSLWIFLALTVILIVGEIVLKASKALSDF